MFNNSIGPFIRDIVRSLSAKAAGILHGCADDLGAAGGIPAYSIAAFGRNSSMCG